MIAWVYIFTALESALTPTACYAASTILAIVADYNRHMGQFDNVDRMANSYTASRRTWKWTKKPFFHLLDLAIVNSYTLLSSHGGKKISHRDFHLTLIREMLA